LKNQNTSKTFIKITKLKTLKLSYKSDFFLYKKPKPNVKCCFSFDVQDHVDYGIKEKLIDLYLKFYVVFVSITVIIF
jgi:hypothetical protein